jgi:hypothetical protein
MSGSVLNKGFVKSYISYDNTDFLVGILAVRNCNLFILFVL